MASIKVTKDQLLEAIRKAGGQTTGICEMLDITRPTLARYLKRWQDAREAVDFAKTRLIDRAEYQLAAAVERGEAWAVQLALKGSKRGRDRGYGDNVDVNDNQPMKVIVEYVNKNTTAQPAPSTDANQE